MANYKKEISLPSDMWDAIDKACDGRPRSKWVARAASAVLGDTVVVSSTKGGKVSPTFDVSKLTGDCRKEAEEFLKTGSLEELVQAIYDMAEAKGKTKENHEQGDRE